MQRWWPSSGRHAQQSSRHYFRHIAVHHWKLGINGQVSTTRDKHYLQWHRTAVHSHGWTCTRYQWWEHQFMFTELYWTDFFSFADDSVFSWLLSWTRQLDGFLFFFLNEFAAAAVATLLSFHHSHLSTSTQSLYYCKLIFHTRLINSGKDRCTTSNKLIPVLCRHSRQLWYDYILI